MTGPRPLTVEPCTITDAKRYIGEHHRHHKPPVGALWAVAVAVGGERCGVAVVGRPVARALQDGYTAEVTRVATDGTRNACSKLYGACRRAAKALGWRKLVTYTLASEPGTSLVASGWERAAETGGGSWDTPSRRRKDKHPTEPKVRWEVQLA